MQHTISYKRYCEIACKNNQRNPYTFTRHVYSQGQYWYTQYWATSAAAYTWHPDIK